MKAFIILLIVAIVILFISLVCCLFANEQLREELGIYKYKEYQEFRDTYREYLEQIGEQLKKEKIEDMIQFEKGKPTADRILAKCQWDDDSEEYYDVLYLQEIGKYYYDCHGDEIPFSVIKEFAEF